MNLNNKLVAERLKKLEAIRGLNINPYPYSYNKTHNAKDLLDKYEKLVKEEKTIDKVSIAGRIMTLRNMGKAAFGHVQDETGKIQFYIREDEVGQDVYLLFNKLDLGDIIGIEGTVFRTKMGEISIWVKSLTILSKSLQPLPEKFHGLKDTE